MLRLHLILTLLLTAGLAHAGQIYHWTDEDGVAHYSQTPPADATVPVETREVTTSTPDDYDPDEYEYSVMNQAERIHAEWAALAEEREKEREARREARRATEERLAYESYDRREDRYGWRYGREVHYPVVHPPARRSGPAARYAVTSSGNWTNSASGANRRPTASTPPATGSASSRRVRWRSRNALLLPPRSPSFLAALRGYPSCSRQKVAAMDTP